MALNLSMSDPASREEVSRRFFAGTGASYDRVVALGTLGLDRYWKRALMAAVPRSSTRVLDLACGTGLVLRALARRCPRATFVGVDVSESYLAVAQHRFGRSPRVELLLANAESVELHGTFDAVVSSYIPKYVDPDRWLDRVEPHLDSNAALALHDFGHPPFPARPVWRLWMRALKHLAPRIWPEWREVFDDNLERLIQRSKWHLYHARALRRRGWREVEVRPLSFGTAILLTAKAPARKTASR